MTDKALHQLTLPDNGADLLRLHQDNPSRYPYLLESVAHGPEQARYNILMAHPRQALVKREEGLYLDDMALDERDFLPVLDRLWRQQAIDTGSSELPFRGGWFLFLGYEMAAEIEPSLKLPPAQDGLPTAFASRIPAAIIQDLERSCIHLISEEAPLLASMREDMEAIGGGVEADQEALPIAIEEEAPERHLEVVERCKRYIIDGDIFQANLSRLWQGELQAPVPASRLYARLRRHNPAPFAGLANFEGSDIISSSPERLVEVRGDKVQTRPIAGTRPRSREEARDQSLSTELLGHPKERAEHIMLIDLERNDLGRICRPGTVEVNELMVLESYAHVHHIVSNVRGQLHEAITPGQVISAVFPGGTITGCPKVRCMEIIAELEGEGRGAYTGSMGYLNHNGDMDLNILIRTLVKHGRQLRLRAGGGIVADSRPEAELAETRAKARGMLRALGLEAEAGETP